MADLKRICVPLSLDCNLQCKYCYRDHDRSLEKVPEFSESMIKYLGQLSPDKCEAVVASGGEPLFHWDKVKELFSYVPKNVHKKIMSNCTLLTQEIVDYINENEIELSASHDGPKTKFLRGVDIFENPRLADLVRQVKILRIVGVSTKYNPDVWENFFDTVTRLKRVDFAYLVSPVMDCPSQHDLVEGFDYDLWFKTWSEFLVSPYYRTLLWYFGQSFDKTGKLTVEQHIRKNAKQRLGKHAHFNVLPDGTVCGMREISANYGNIWDDYDDLYDAAIGNIVKTQYCKKCVYKEKCFINVPCYSEHTFKVRNLTNSIVFNPDRKEELREYVAAHIHEIEEKYGFVKENFVKGV